MFDQYPKPKRSQIIASKGEHTVRRFIQWIMTSLGLYVVLPAILLSVKDFSFALITWVIILLLIYFVINPILRFFKIYFIDKLFDTKERYRKQIIERLLSYYTYTAQVGWNEAKEYVDSLEARYPTTKELETWLDSKEMQ